MPTTIVHTPMHTHMELHDPVVPPLESYIHGNETITITPVPRLNQYHTVAGIMYPLFDVAVTTVYTCTVNRHLCVCVHYQSVVHLYMISATC